MYLHNNTIAQKQSAGATMHMLWKKRIVLAISNLASAVRG